MKNQNKAAVDRLLSVATPQQYISFLFDLQLSFMAAGCFVNYTEKGFEHHVLHLGALKNFLEELMEDR